ncbi:MAG: hypothetical protein QOE98_1736 [Gaiellaceae bacterium]|nr:hypothetical protein [Gaiellaceae bacterium]
MARPISNHREADVTTTRLGRRLLTVAAAAAAALVAAPAAGAAPLTPNCTPAGSEQLCEVWASASSVTLGGDPLPTWRFTASAGGADRPPIVVTQGDAVRIRLHNTLDLPVSLAMPQLQGVLYGPIDAASARGADKVGVDNTPLSGRDYTFTASRPGTFLYEAGPTASGKQQVAMGLVGAIVVLPSAPGQAYASATTAYDDEAVLVLTGVDPALNGAADPGTFNLRTFDPQYWLVNGDPTTDQLVVAPGAKLLLRYVNGGIQNRWAGLLGLHQQRIGTNAEPLANLLTGDNQAQTGVVAALPAGGSAETLVTLPEDPGKAGFRYPVFDEGRTMVATNNGLLAYVEVSGTLSLPSCPAETAGTIPPIVDGLSTPPKGHVANLASPAATIVFNVTGRAVECRGVSGVEAPGTGVRYAIDTLPGAGALTAPVDNNGGFSIDLSETDVAGIATGGHHYLIVQAEKNGVWGAVSAVQLIVDNAAPELSVKASPAITNAAGSITITGSASDRYLGDSDVVSVAWSLDGDPGDPPTVTPAVVTPVDITVPAAGLAEGPHTVTVTATDSFGNTSLPVAVQVTVDSSAPAVSDVAIEQRLPADALHPFGGIPTNQNNGTLTFDPNFWAVRVRGTATDTVSTIKGIRGSFDDAFCTTVAGAPPIAGARLDPKDGSWSDMTEAGFAYVPLSELNRWLPPVGAPALTKAFNVRARDGAGNWSACATGTVILDRTSPAITVPLQVAINGEGNVAARASSRARSTLVVRLSASDPQGISAAEFFDGADPGRGKGIALRATDGKIDETAEALAASTSVRRWTPGVHRILARVRDNAGNWSAPIAANITVSFPRIFADGFESHRLKLWSNLTGGKRVAVSTRARAHGRYGLRIVTSKRPAFLTDTTPARATSYRASFSLETGTASTGGAWQTVFAAVDQRGRTALAVQRRTSAAGQVVRIVTQRRGRAVDSSQTLLSGQRHVISIAWFGAADGEAGLWVDGRLAARVTNLGNAGQMIETARLGQVGGGNAGTRGDILVADFNSTK